jgi:hypothetical protein
MKSLNPDCKFVGCESKLVPPERKLEALTLELHCFVRLEIHSPLPAMLMRVRQIFPA